jgi:hypothetical protein
MLTDVIPDIYGAIIPALIDSLPILLNSLGILVMEIFKALPDLLISGLLLGNPIGLFFMALDGILQSYFGVSFIDKIKEFVQSVLDSLEEKISKFKDIGKNIVEGIKSGIKGAWNNLVSWFKGLFGDLIGIAKKILGIRSPSRVFRDQIGKQMAAGLGLGWEDEFGKVKSDIEDSLAFDDASVGINASIRKVGAGTAGGAFGGNSFGDVYINIDGAIYEDPQSLAVAVAEELQNMTDRRLAVYA